MIIQHPPIPLTIDGVIPGPGRQQVTIEPVYIGNGDGNGLIAAVRITAEGPHGERRSLRVPMAALPVLVARMQEYLAADTIADDDIIGDWTVEE